MRVEWGVADAPGEKVRKHVELFTAVQMREQLRGGRSTIVASFADELAAFAEALRAGTAAPPTGLDGLAALRMAHAVYRSSKEGVEVKL